MVNVGPLNAREVVQDLLNRAQSYRIGSRARTNLLLEAQVRAVMLAAETKPVIPFGPPSPLAATHPAMLPRPKNGLCPVCKHYIGGHGMEGCYATDCECLQPLGRLVPPMPIPDDISTITEA